MTWVGIGVAAVGTAGSLYAGDKKRQAMDKFNKGQAEMSRYAYLTGHPGQQTFDGSSAVGDGIAGLGAGLQQGIAARNAFADKPAAVDPTPTSAEIQHPGGQQLEAFNSINQPQDPQSPYNLGLGQQPQGSRFGLVSRR